FTPPLAPSISTLSLHDALPISKQAPNCSAMRTSFHFSPALSPIFAGFHVLDWRPVGCLLAAMMWLGPKGQAAESELIAPGTRLRSEEHTSELQSLAYLVCRLLL